jgi:hippurate hydrolase
MTSSTSLLLAQLQSVAAEFVEIRRSIHAHPELAFEETRTSDMVAESLARWGYAVHRGLGVTGVVGVLKKGSGSKSLGIRADMDALPSMKEQAWTMPAACPGKCTPAVMTDIPPSCCARQSTLPRSSISTVR